MNGTVETYRKQRLLCWARRTGPLRKLNKVEYPKRSRVHHEEEVQQTVQSTGCP